MSQTKKTNKLSEETTAARRKAIFTAAFECFLQYGYAKVSLDDIAKKARLSRPLLYLQFKNKEDLFVEMLRDLYMGLISEAHHIPELKISKKEKLNLIYEEILLKLWSRIIKSPNGKEFFDECWQVCPQLAKDYDRETLKLLDAIFDDKKHAELFMLCINGLCSDEPTTATLRKRVQLLADHFLRED